jgi:FKBP-type peptidyl-prolyl cis-trans isomerase
MLMLAMRLRPFLFLFFLLAACGSDPEEKERMSPKEREAFRDSIMKENKRLARYEDRAIEDYIERRKWDMKKTGTGLRYMVREEGSGEKAKRGMVAKVRYRVELLSGETLYSSKRKGPKSFLIGRDNEVTGLHQGVQYMREGGDAVFILPYHLAHGLLGDMKKVPMHASLVYHIELIDLHPPRRTP